MVKNLIKTNIGRRFALLSLLVLGAITLAACSGSDGSAGVQGPAGPEGPQGPAGPEGPQGPAGDVSALPGPFAATQQGNFSAIDDPSTSEDDGCSFLTGVPDASVCTFTLSGGGLSNLLGDYTEEATWLVAIPNLANVGIESAAIMSGSVVFTSASGEVHLEAIGGVGTLMISGPPNDEGVMQGVVTPPQPFTIVGGTGEFASATGSVVRTGSFDASAVLPGGPGTFNIAYVGSIAF